MSTKTLLRLLLASALMLTLHGCAGVAGFDTGRAEALSMEMAEFEPQELSVTPVLEVKGDARTDIQPSRTIATERFIEVKAPELLARIAGPELEPIRLLAQDITVVVVGHRARVVFDMVFHNAADLELAGTLLVQIPNRAGPSLVGMYPGNPLPGTDWTAGPEASLLLPASTPEPEALLAADPQLIGSWQAGNTQVEWGDFRRAVVVEPVKGRQVYEAITRKKVDPALGEWTGTGSYSTRIFPIPAKGLKRIVFAYDQTLVPSEGSVTFELPVASAAVVHRRLTVHDIGTSYSQSVLRSGLGDVAPDRSRYGRVWQMDLSGAPSPTYQFRATMRNPAFLHITGADEGISGALTTLIYTPDAPPRSMVTSTGRALILLDTSYSAKDGMHAVSGQILRALLESDDSLTEFAIVCFDVRPTLLTAGFVPNTGEAREHYLSEIGRIWLEGATDFDAALSYISERPALADADTIFLLSDGQITWGSDSVPALITKHQDLVESRWICFSVGSVPQNLDLYDTLTRSGGQIVPVVPSQNLDRAARAHRYPVSRLDGVFSMFQDEIIVAGDPEFVYPGQVLEVAVRSNRATQDVRLVIRVEGRESELKVPLARVPLTDPIAARTWAEIYTKDLLSDPDEASIQAALSLSRHFSLTSEYASFIILETDEEYKQHEIEAPAFDFRQIRLTIAEGRAEPREPPRLYSGLSIPPSLGKDKAALIKGLAFLKGLAVWDTGEPRTIAYDPDVLVGVPPVGRESDSFTSLYMQGTQLLARMGGIDRADDEKADAAREAAQALRVLSSIAEVAPRDAQALRLTGFVLMDWGFYTEASRIFTRVRESRPFEPQNLLLEAMSLSASGLPGHAALRYEVVLETTFPRFDEYAKPVARFLYADLLRVVLREEPDHPYVRVWQDRLASLSAEQSQELPAGVLFLYWNLDDTDVDLHVKENVLSRVWYERPESRTGGKLMWDNTGGLGPEMYVHPKLSRAGFEVGVNYFSSSSVEGAAPAATLVCALTKLSDTEAYRAEWHARILVGVHEELVEVMPLWKRGS
jgi:hypothetical protein